MKVALKERNIADGKSAMYLHTFYAGKHSIKPLELAVYDNPKNQKEKRENRFAYEVAEKRRGLIGTARQICWNPSKRSQQGKLHCFL